MIQCVGSRSPENPNCSRICCQAAIKNALRKGDHPYVFPDKKPGEDDWHFGYTGAPANGAAWVESPRVSYCVTRGGGWSSSGNDCRSARRYDNTPSDTGYNIGFRLSR